MFRYVFTVAYDGTDYHGWQDQPMVSTIAGTISKAYARVFNRAVTVIGVSRTDAGVHARGQVATFISPLATDVFKMHRALNKVLPISIVIRSMRAVEPSYTPFAAIAYKTYHYRLFLEQPLPEHARYGWYLYQRFDRVVFERALALFVGTCDFRSFSTGMERGDDTIRTIDSIEVVYEVSTNSYLVIVKGEKFLHHMVRRIVGAAVDVAIGRSVSVECLRRILHERDPRQTLTNAPPWGLTLDAIVYHHELNGPN